MKSANIKEALAKAKVAEPAKPVKTVATYTACKPVVIQAPAQAVRSSRASTPRNNAYDSAVANTKAHPYSFHTAFRANDLTGDADHEADQFSYMNL